MSDYKRPTTKVECCNCGAEINKDNRELKRTSNNFCSLKCVGEYKTKMSNPLGYNRSLALNTAKKKNLEFNLSSEFLYELYIKQNKRCAVSGVIIEPVDKKCKKINQVSIDRIDNSKGYTVDNVHLVALGINYLRNTFTIDDTLELISNIKWCE